ncbi:NEDD4 family-interacting protein 1-like isoform X1 [Myxocyprinus asiaticus]|uniref:NEDD4 family-interacting protein 1-like isoform X1 n=1 Tax=Myxocyprinus asiaticus TaxID=70543 RepID=UPI00222206B9|nr:NEDD4 family-interacting protein 1-like isoform X1 [Myxocyprinus asiaticus]
MKMDQATSRYQVRDPPSPQVPSSTSPTCWTADVGLPLPPRHPNRVPGPQACLGFHLEPLHNEDDPSEGSASGEPSTFSQAAAAVGGISNPSTTDTEAPPPPYASVALGATAAPESTFPGDFPVPPPYSIATSLPTYDEAEKAKAAAMAASAVDVIARDEDFPVRDDFSDADQLRVGNDGIFMLAFFMAFLFNWIGFCLSFCLTNTIAGRYGAICGFGLSLIKWILIVRFSDYFTGYFNGQYWLWWIFLVLGLLLFFRGFVNYLKVRNMSESMVSSLRTRFFLLY